jgi:transcriptional regulator with XRE-family HTH domain
MEMKIDGQAVRIQRAKRAWSQEHLAGAAGLSLRTVQRIESKGIASNDSVRALAAVFNCSVESLCTVPHRVSHRYPLWSIRIGAAFSGGAFAGFLLASATTASALDFTVQTFLNGKPLAVSREQTEESFTIPLIDSTLQERARVKIVANELKDGRVRLDLVLYDCKASQCVVSGHPAMITNPGAPARVEWTMDGGDVAAYVVTPSR